MTDQEVKETRLKRLLQMLVTRDAYDAIMDCDSRFDLLSDIICAFERAYPIEYGFAIADAIKEVLEDGGTEEEITGAGYEIPEKELMP